MEGGSGISEQLAGRPLVSGEWLAEHLHHVTVADVRWYLDGRSGFEAYLDGHVPTATFVDLDACLADPPSREAGRHPLPSPQRFAAGLSAAGIGDESAIVAYDDSGGMAAARLIWMLRAIGRPAALLDGGLAAWSDELEKGPGGFSPARFTATPWPAAKLADIDEVASAPLLIDARSPDRFGGSHEPVDPRAGHIPGARNLYFGDNLQADGRFVPADRLAERFASAGVQGRGEGVVVYCGSGVSACHDLLAMEVAGIDRARLYPGSWSQWSATDDRPVECGAGPSSHSASLPEAP
ncbi:MAG: sulfurtransferase [Actinomycetota bacterium]|nr:sulfurtransferase [Actinomycetota bacterium]